MGMYLSHNLGDVAIQLAVMRALKSRRPEIEFVGLSQDPLDTVKLFGIPAMAASGRTDVLMPSHNASLAPVATAETCNSRIAAWHARLRSALRIRRAMGGLDMLLVSGSGQIDDFWGGAWAQPYNMMAWSLVARWQRKPVAVFGVGVDELATRLGARFCLSAVNSAAICVVRDPGSRAVLEDLGCRRPVDVLPDPAFHLDRLPKGNANVPAFAVISPISRRAWPGAEDEDYDRYLSVLALVADTLLSRGSGVHFVCSQTRMDPPVVERVQARMKEDASRAPLVRVDSVDGYLDAVAGARVVIGSRLHALILAMVAGTPVVAISAVRKVHQQFADMAMSELAFDLRAIDVAQLINRVQDAVDDQAGGRRRVVEVVRASRARLDSGFDRLATLIPGAPG